MLLLNIIIDSIVIGRLKNIFVNLVIIKALTLNLKLIFMQYIMGENEPKERKHRVAKHQS